MVFKSATHCKEEKNEILEKKLSKFLCIPQVYMQGRMQFARSSFNKMGGKRLSLHFRVTL